MRILHLVMKKEILDIDGHRIGFRCYGDPDGFPVIMHHGLVGSCNLLNYWGAKSKKAGVFLIAVERPGYGASDHREDMQRIMDWPEILRPLLDHFHCKEFGAVGISAGAPYAYSLGAHFPERVKGIWILSGIPYLVGETILSCYPEEKQAVYRYYKSAPLGDIAERLEDYLNTVYNTHPENSQVRKDVAAARANGRLGIAREVKLQISDWGFRPSDIVSPVTLWHSRKDDIVPFAAVEKTAVLIPDATLNIQQESTHYPSSASITKMFGSIYSRVSGK